MQYDDYSYGQVYAAWQAEMREQAAVDALARRIRRERRAEHRANQPGVAPKRRLFSQLRARSS